MATEITRDLAQTLSTEIEAALKAVAVRHGLNVKVSGGKYMDSSFTPRVEFTVPGEVGVSKKDEDAFKTLAALYGLDPAWLGKTFVLKGDTYRVIGLAPGRSKNCVKILRVRDSSPRVCPVTFVKAGVFC
jgi:hypothetical protein